MIYLFKVYVLVIVLIFGSALILFLISSLSQTLRTVPKLIGSNSAQPPLPMRESP
jgi:hypothetical protein